MYNNNKLSACGSGNVLCDICGEPIIKAYYGADGVLCGDPIKCKCIIEQEERLNEEQKRLQFQREVAMYRRNAFAHPKDAECTFAIDDNRNYTASQTAKKYIRNYDMMKDENYGIIIVGPNGTGKTFLSKCIANALIDKGVVAHVTKLQNLIDEITANNYKNKYQVLNDIGWYELLVIDEFKADISTAKVIEMIADARYEARKPLIITTNLMPREFINPPNEFIRTFDRIREMCCIHIVLNGESRRPDIGAQKRELFNNLV